MMWISGFWLPWRTPRPSRCSMSAGRHGQSRWWIAMHRSWMLVPTPIFSVEPTSTRDVAGAAGGEQAGLLGVVARLVDEPDLLGGEASGGEQLAQLVVGVPPIRVGCGEVAEDDLQRAGDRRGVAGRGAVDLVAVLAPEAGDGVGGVVELAGCRGLLPGDEPGVERGFAAVGGDLEHVVLLRRDHPAADGVGAARERLHVGLELGARVDQHRLRGALPVSALGELRGGELELAFQAVTTSLALSGGGR